MDIDDVKRRKWGAEQAIRTILADLAVDTGCHVADLTVHHVEVTGSGHFNKVYAVSHVSIKLDV